MEITIKAPRSPYDSRIDTGANEVTIREAYLGVSLMTDDGRVVVVMMRDNWFEFTDGEGNHYKLVKVEL